MELSPFIGKSVSFLMVIFLAFSVQLFVGQGSGTENPVRSPQQDEDVRTRQLVFSGSGLSDLQMSMDGNGRMDIAWVDSRDGNPEIYFLKFEENGWKLHDDMRLTTSQTDSIMPSLCPTMDHTTTLVWVEDLEDGSSTIRTTTLKYDGGDILLVAEPRSIARSINLTGRPVLKPSPSGNANVMWAEGLDENKSRLRVATIDPLSDDIPENRTVFSSLGLLTSWDFEPLSEDDFIASWNGQYIPDGSTDPNYGVFFTRFKSDGEVLVQPLRKSITSYQTRPDIEFSNDLVTLVFSTRRYAYMDVMLTTFTMDGTDIMDDVPVSDLSTSNKDPSLLIGTDGSASLLWFRNDNSKWSLVHMDLELDDTVENPGEMKTMATDVLDLDHPPAQIITEGGDLHTSYISSEGEAGIYLVSRTRPDLELGDIRVLDDLNAITGENITIEADLINNGNSNISDICLRFVLKMGDIVVHQEDITTSCDPGSINKRNISIMPESEGTYTAVVEVDPEDELTEKNETNNKMETNFFVGDQEVSISTSSKAILPGERGYLSVTLINTGSVDVRYLIEVQGDNIDWFSEKEGLIDVRSGDTSTLDFGFSPSSETRAGKYLMVVRGTSLREKKDPVMDTHQVEVLPFYNSSVDFGNYEREIDPGTQLSIPVTIYNHGNSWTKFRIEGNNSMSLDMKYEGAPLPLILPTVQSGGSLNINILLDIPEGLQPGKTIEVYISLRNQEAGQTYTANYNLTIMEMPDPEITLEEEDLDLDGDWSIKTVAVTVKNTGNVRDIFRFSVKAQTGEWDVIVLEPYSGEAPLSPGEEMNVTLSIVPPPIPMIGSKLFTFSATPSIRENMRTDHIFHINVGEKYNVSFTQNKLELDTEPGINHRLMLTYTNTGNKDAQFSLMFSGPGSEGLYVEPMTGGRILWNESVPIQIASGATNSFWVEVTVPDEMKDNKLVVNVTCLEDTSVSDELMIFFSVPEDTLMKNLLIGSMVALVIATVGIIVVVSKFLMKRRTKASVDLLDDELD